MDCEEELSAYHEAGHAVVAHALGGEIESVQLGGEADSWLPERFGDCRINWGPVDPNADFQRQREIVALLAGPAAEMIYSGGDVDPSMFGPWAADWMMARSMAVALTGDPQRAQAILVQSLQQLDRILRRDDCWAALAEIADQLLTHEFVDGETVQQIVGFWGRYGG
ncbi:cell division protein FtsH [Crateriforma spongiae]|uniref:cell division protein FtsH n=1 Tax=Crateriforma spongiae TaxID=2724528 RepID=UPI0014453C38|nr:cell division protein FtsH [Crateriforma spongiae]